MVNTKNLDMLLINPGSIRKRVYQDLSKDLTAIEPPFWSAITANFLRNKGYNVDILDANAENLDIHETAIKALKSNARFINIIVYGQNPSASTTLMESVSNLCTEIKKLDIDSKVVLSGGHPSALPKRTMNDESCDFVIEGEGFYTSLELLEGIDSNKIEGLWWRNEKNLIIGNQRSKNIEHLTSDLSDVAWDLLPMDKYRAHNWQCFHDFESRNNYSSIYTSFGCPYTCTFCCINAPFGKPSYRTWKPEWVLNQIDTLVKKYNTKNLKIIDELFVLDPNHFMPIANGLIKRDYNLNVWAYARVDIMKDEYLMALKKAGFNLLGFGIEAGNQKVRNVVQKGKFERQDILEMRKRLEDFGISMGGNYIFGLPEDTMETMQQTLDLALELNCEWPNLYSAMAYPGSKLYEIAKQKGIPLPDDKDGPGWVGYSQYSYDCMPLPTRTLSSADVLRFRDHAFDVYFKNPQYLNMINAKFGIKAVQHIEEMAKVKIKRRLLGD